MTEHKETEGGEPNRADCEALDWGYDTPVSRGRRIVRPAVVPDEVTIAPPPKRAAALVKPKLRAPQPDYRIWMAAFGTVGVLSAAILTLLALVLAVG